MLARGLQILWLTGITMKSNEFHVRLADRSLDIIAVDDMRSMRWRVHRLMSRYGQRIRVASNGRQALQLATCAPPDLLITDLEMPGGDGFGLICALRRSNDARLRSLPIVVCSSRGDELYLDRALEVGADLFVTKPLNARELQIALENLGD